MPRYDASYLDDIRKKYRRLQREVKGAKPIRMEGRKLQRTLPNPVAQLFKDRRKRMVK